MRNENAGRETTAIEYQAYGSMAELEMAKLAEALAREFPQVQIRMRHRVGRLAVGDASVAIAAVSPHRAEAFAACRAAIDRLKTTVPIWKKEFHPDGSSRLGRHEPSPRRGALRVARRGALQGRL